MVNFIISENEQDFVKKFITFNRDNDTLVDNYFLNDFKVVIKIPFVENKNSQPEIIIEEFSLVNEIFLTSY